MLGTRIAALRRQRKMSQKELAQQLGVRPSTIGMYEQGRREPDCAGLVRLAELFSVSTDFLLTGKARGAEDASALAVLWHLACERLDGRLVLRAPDGSERLFDEAELALLFSALLSRAED